MQYQSFPDAQGGSQSLEKLTALRLPPLVGKSFLDVGCNEGFFCGFAQFEGASRIVGLDRSAKAIKRASVRFPDIEFLRRSWDALPDGKFDVVTLLSAIHYADDQEALVHRLMEHVSAKGVLVLELGIAAGGKDTWVKVERSIDERLFPTRVKLGSMLQRYAWKVMGHSVMQAGDPVQRYVVHVRHKRPYAYLLLGEPGSGKSTVVRHLFARLKMPVVSGDGIYRKLSLRKIAGASNGIEDIAERDYVSSRIDRLTNALFEQDFGVELVRLWVEQAGYRDFALDTYVPQEWQDLVIAELESHGYYPVTMTMQSPERTTTAEASSRVLAYRSHLVALAKQRPKQPVFKISRTRATQLPRVLRWHLDSPQSGLWSETDGTVDVAGWLVTKEPPASPLRIELRSAGKKVASASFSRQRLDVLKTVFESEDAVPDYWRDNACGFGFSVPKDAFFQGCELILKLDGESCLLARMSLSDSDKEPRQGVVDAAGSAVTGAKGLAKNILSRFGVGSKSDASR